MRVSVSVCLFVLFFFFSKGSSLATGPYVLTSTVNLTQYGCIDDVWQMAVQNTTGDLFIGCGGGNSPDTGAFIKILGSVNGLTNTITLMGIYADINQIAISPSGEDVYVVATSDNQIVKYPGGTTPTSSLTMGFCTSGGHPHGVAIAPDGYVYGGCDSSFNYWAPGGTGSPTGMSGACIGTGNFCFARWMAADLGNGNILGLSVAAEALYYWPGGHGNTRFQVNPASGSCSSVNVVVVSSITHDAYADCEGNGIGLLRYAWTGSSYQTGVSLVGTVCSSWGTITWNEIGGLFAVCEDQGNLYNWNTTAAVSNWPPVIIGVEGTNVQNIGNRPHGVAATINAWQVYSVNNTWGSPGGYVALNVYTSTVVQNPFSCAANATFQVSTQRCVCNTFGYAPGSSCNTWNPCGYPGSITCFNGGSCTNNATVGGSPATYCTCPPQYSDSLCTVLYDDCIGNPCGPLPTCTSIPRTQQGIPNFSCNCSAPDIAGPYCNLTYSSTDCQSTVCGIDTYCVASPRVTFGVPNTQCLAIPTLSFIPESFDFYTVRSSNLACGTSGTRIGNGATLVSCMNDALNNATMCNNAFCQTDFVWRSGQFCDQLGSCTLSSDLPLSQSYTTTNPYVVGIRPLTPSQIAQAAPAQCIFCPTAIDLSVHNGAGLWTFTSSLKSCNWYYNTTLSISAASAREYYVYGNYPATHGVLVQNNVICGTGANVDACPAGSGYSGSGGWLQVPCLPGGLNPNQTNIVNSLAGSTSALYYRPDCSGAFGPGYIYEFVNSANQCTWDPCFWYANTYANDPCSTQGTCTNNATASAAPLFTCTCNYGYVGANCQTWNPCAYNNNPCLNGATCNIGTVGANPGYTCSCAPGFVNATCDSWDPCRSNNTCLNGGSCVANTTVGGFPTETCVCPTGYVGSACQTWNPCQYNNSCQYQQFGTTCVNNATVGGFPQSSCNCPTGLDGQFCQTWEPCQISNPCQNGAMCVNNATVEGNPQDMCICTPGYVGVNCTVWNPCQYNNPCLDGSTCVNNATVGGSPQQTCTCLPGWTGIDCQTWDPCTYNNPCQHGTCVNNATQNGSPQSSCTCSPGYVGSTCATWNPCLYNSTYCFNGATCVNNATAGGVPSQTCTCAPNYVGTNCQQWNPCAYSNTCQNGGTCNNNATVGGSPSLFCTQCSTGYIGNLCQSWNPCAYNNTCQNGATCVNNATVGGFPQSSCSCASGFTGPLCQLWNPCSLSNPCVNGATCVNNATQSGSPQSSCTCPPALYGPTCAVWNPCLYYNTTCFNGGVCTANSTISGAPADFCDCSGTGGFTGNQCQIGPTTTTTTTTSTTSTTSTTTSTTTTTAPVNTTTSTTSTSTTTTTVAPVVPTTTTVPPSSQLVTNCTGVDCGPHGSCKLTNNAVGYTCSCLPGWTGSQCSVPYTVQPVAIPVNASSLEIGNPNIPFQLYVSFPNVTTQFFAALFSDAGNVTQSRVFITAVLNNVQNTPSSRRRLLSTTTANGVIVNGYIAPCPVVNGSTTCTSAQQALFNIIACFEQRRSNCFGNNTAQAIQQMQTLAASANITINATQVLQNIQTFSTTVLGCGPQVEYDIFDGQCDLQCYLATPYAQSMGSVPMNFPQSSITLVRVPFTGQTLWAELTGSPNFLTQGTALGASPFRFTFVPATPSTIYSINTTATLSLPSANVTLPLWSLNATAGDSLTPAQWAFMPLPNSISGISFTLQNSVATAVPALASNPVNPTYTSWQMGVWLWMPSTKFSNIATVILAKTGGVWLTLDPVNGIQCLSSQNPSVTAAFNFTALTTQVNQWLFISCALDVVSVNTTSGSASGFLYLHVTGQNMRSLRGVSFASTPVTLISTVLNAKTLLLYTTCTTQGNPLTAYDCPMITEFQIWGLNALDTGGGINVLDNILFNIYLTVMNRRGVLNALQGALCVDSLYGQTVGNPMVDYQGSCALDLGRPCQNGVCEHFLGTTSPFNTTVSTFPFEDDWGCVCLAGFAGTACDQIATTTTTTTTVAPTTTLPPSTTLLGATTTAGSSSGLSDTNRTIVIVVTTVVGGVAIFAVLAWYLLKYQASQGIIYSAPGRSIRAGNEQTSVFG